MSEISPLASPRESAKLSSRPKLSSTPTALREEQDESRRAASPESAAAADIGRRCAQVTALLIGVLLKRYGISLDATLQSLGVRSHARITPPRARLPPAVPPLPDMFPK